MIGDDYGVRWMTNYQLSSSPPSASRTDRLIAGMLPESKLLPPGTYGFNSPYVSRFTGMMIEPPRLLRALLRDIRLAGGRVVVRDFHTPADITALPEALVFNCTGLGSNRSEEHTSELQSLMRISYAVF